MTARVPAAPRAILILVLMLAGGTGTGAVHAQQGASTNGVPRQVQEFYNTTNGHFVLLSDPAEIAIVDSGAVGPWVRSGYSFHVLDDRWNAKNVCRFYSARANSHFFTANAQECEYLRTHDAGWQFEEMAFAADVPVDGRCPAEGEVPVYRLYNDRWAFDDSAHRYTVDRDLRNERLAQGWLDEGVAFCATDAYHTPRRSDLVVTPTVLPDGQCEDESINLGACVALNQLPPMPFVAGGRLLPPLGGYGPYYSPLYGELTGASGAVRTAQAPWDTQAVLAHSFVQVPDGLGDFGIHVASRDRTTGELASINPLYQYRTSAPEPGQADGRVFPWAGPLDTELQISFSLDLHLVKKLEPSGHAYGHPTLQFRDTKGGHQLYVTLQAYGTVPPRDFVAFDVATGRVIVSTVFRAVPAFGQRLLGDFVFCPGDGSCEGADRFKRDFAFSMNRAAFIAVIAKARELDPDLSADPGDYLMANFHFNNEVYRGAEIAGALANYRLELFTDY